MGTNQTDDVGYGADGAVVNKIRSFYRSLIHAVFYILQSKAISVRGMRGTSLHINLGTEWNWSVSDTLRPLYHPLKELPVKGKKNAKQTRYRSGQALRVPGG